MPYFHVCTATRTVAVLSGRDFTSAMRPKPKEYANVKLYVRGQLALAHLDELIPQLLNFLVVGVDPEGLPVNFSGETLPEQILARDDEKQCLDMLAQIPRTVMITGSSVNSLANV